MNPFPPDAIVYGGQSLVSSGQTPGREWDEASAEQMAQEE